MGIDIGTSGCKVIVLSSEGEVISKKSASYNLLSIKEGFFVLNPEDVWIKITRCIKEANCVANEAADSVSAISFSCQGEAIIPVDSKSMALDNSPVSSDMRGTAYLKKFSKNFDREELYCRTGQLIDPIHSLLNTMVGDNKRMDCKFVCFDAFVCLNSSFLLSGYSAANTLLLITKQGICSDILEYASLKECQLPQVLPSTSLIGTIPEEIATQLCFNENTKVYVGGHDQSCSAFGSGLNHLGANYSIGTTECLSLITKEPFNDYRLGIPCYPHVVNNHFISLIGSQTGARVLTWIAELLFKSKDLQEDFFQMIRTIDSHLQTDAIFLAHMAGSNYYHDPNAKAMLCNITFATTREEIIKAVFEGITFEQYLGFSALSNLSVWQELKEFRIVGGGSTIDNVQMSDIFDRTMITLTKHDTGAIGAAMLAGLGNGTFRTEDIAITKCVKESKRFKPDQSMKNYYTEKVERYDAIYRGRYDFQRK